ncbi:MAG: tetratricopeptide repeat protein [Halobacteriovoraceae bacterium]|nr:tetratricopeptide repeat protein [Halobacteriovoraceae bacterium]
MENRIFKLLTFIWIIFSCAATIASDNFTTEQNQTHLRWNIFSPKNQLVIDKKGNTVTLKTLNTALFDRLRNDLDGIGPDSTYVKSISITKPETATNVAAVKIVLRNKDVELFSFYRDREKKYVLDFWMDEDFSAKNDLHNTKKISQIKGKKIVAGTAAPLPSQKKRVLLKQKAPLKISKEVAPETAKYQAPKKAYLDYRYGSSFVWDYDPLAPVHKKSLDLSRKTPEYFYPIKNRNISKGEKEAHTQLSINLYRKKKYGLMYKSIKLFNKKYGEVANSSIHEYLKANAIVRSNFDKGNGEPLKMAISMFENIAEKTENYDLQRAVLKYLIDYYSNENEHVKSLQLSKKLYVVSKENFDYEESQLAAENIILKLTLLNQIGRVKTVLQEKTIQKLISKQKILAYQIFVGLKLGKVDEVIRLYEKNRRNLAKPVHKVILYNTGEAYFRKGQFGKAIKLFDQFIDQYSFHSSAGAARVRIALCYELSGKPVKQTLALYKNAINRAQNADHNYEARIRYVGLQGLRKKVLTAEDREIRVFLDKRVKRKAKLDKNLKKILWLTRLRTYIKDSKFKEALAYLNAVPVRSLRPSERRVFNGDGAEIVYGIIQKYFNASEHTKVIQTWEAYKTKYLNKVANDPYMNFIVGRTYINLGLYNAFDKIYAGFSKLNGSPVKTFPLWVPRKISITNAAMLSELQVLKNIKLKNWRLAAVKVAALAKSRKNLRKVKYYQGVISYNQKDYKNAVKAFESFLTSKEEGVNEEVSSPIEVAEMLKSYTDSLYSLGKLKKFSEVAHALLSDTESYGKKNKYMNEVRERIAYLKLEIRAGKATSIDYAILEPEILKFKKEYEKSVYRGRVNYLLGLSLISNKKPEEGKKVLSEVLLDDTISDYLKELARSELSLIQIKERTL